MKHLLVSGIGRSGTSAFRMSLGMHPEIYYNDHENNIVQDVLDVAQVNCTKQSRAASMVVEQAEYDSAFLDLFHSLIWPNRRQRTSATWLMAAVNLYPEVADYAIQVFPNTKLIYLVRNGIEVISSRMRYRSFAQSEFESHCQLWLRAGQMIDWGNATLQPEQFMVVRQEWFHESQLLSERLDQLWQWLGLSPCPQSFEHLLNKRYHPTVDGDDAGQVRMRYESFTEAQRVQFQAERRERWRNWTDEQRDTFEKICGNQMHQLEYEIPWQ